MPKVLTREQLQSRKAKAVRFVRDVLSDPDRADEIEDENLEHYADRRKIEMVNPFWRKREMATKADLLERVKELEEENEELQDQLDKVADIVAPYEDEDEGDSEDGDDEDEGEE